MDRPYQRKNGASHVYSKLKALLVNYKFRPDTQLHPAKLAGRLNVSSTPVREALHRLAGEHLLLSIPNKGFYTKVLAFDEMAELFVLSNVLLQHAISGSSFRPNATQVTALFTDLTRPIRADDVSSAVQFIEEAFTRVAGLSTNRSLSVMIQNFNDRTHYVRILDLELDERRAYLVQQTKSLVDHVRHNNTSEAIRSLQDQLSFNMAGLPDLVREGLVRSYAMADAYNTPGERIASSTLMLDRNPT